MNGMTAREKAILVGVALGRTSPRDAQATLDELRRLAESAGAQPVETLTQRRPRPDPAFLLGRGKVQEIARAAEAAGAELVLVDESLTPAQQRNWEEVMGNETPVKVVDRTRLILDIFAQRARTAEGKLQVELAQLTYLLPRLTGRGASLGQQVGGIGFRGGAGERKLETDRRKIRDRIAFLKDRLERVIATRVQQRSARRSVPMPVVALVGYTNAGKSTLLNALAAGPSDGRGDGPAVTADQLFVTLDPLTRRVRMPDGRPILVSDTVGFIQKLPHTLVAAFRATLEAVREADLLIHVVDAGHPEAGRQMDAVRDVLDELGILETPCVLALNKADRAPDPDLLRRLSRRVHSDGWAACSALNRLGIDALLNAVGEILNDRHPETFLIPYQAYGALAGLFDRGLVRKTVHTAKGVRVTADVDEKLSGQLASYHV